MTKTEKLQSLLSKLKTNSGENYTAIESVATEIQELSEALISDYNSEVEAHKVTTAESIKRKNQIKELKSSETELGEELKQVEELKAQIEQLTSSKDALNSRLKEYDGEIISKYKERHNSFKIGESDYKKYFDLPENLDDLTVEQARRNNSELDKLIELKVFEKKSTDTGTPQPNSTKNETLDLKKIYSKSNY